jgi:RimJ/RimL family protein N-acetyltransferase
MTAYIYPSHKKADLGLLIGKKDCWGHGYGQDAWDTLMGVFIRQGIHKITGGTLAYNKGMLRIMERSAMHHEATKTAHEWVDGRAENIHYYAFFPKRSEE